MILGNFYVYFLHYSHAMQSNDNKEWVSSTLKKNGDNHELKDKCVPKNHHGVTDLIGSVAAEGDYRDEEN